MISITRIAVAAAAVVTLAGTPALAKKCEYVKNGECYGSTTYVYKTKPKSWTDPSAYTKPAEKCRATCLRDAMKWGTSDAQAAYFNMCKKNNGCA
jgi:hypothetical protein